MTRTHLWLKCYLLFQRSMKLETPMAASDGYFPAQASIASSPIEKCA
jgi:hypothetical protein